MSMSDQYLDSSNVNRQTRNKNQIVNHLIIISECEYKNPTSKEENI